MSCSWFLLICILKPRWNSQMYALRQSFCWIVCNSNNMHWISVGEVLLELLFVIFWLFTLSRLLLGMGFYSFLYSLFVMEAWFFIDIKIAANVFGKPKANTDYMPYNGDGFKLSVPSKWNPSKEREFPGQVLRYEDNFDSNSNLSVIINPTDKKTIKDFGSPEEFLSQVV